MNPHLLCYVSREFDGRFVHVSRSVSRTRVSTLGVENGTKALLFILVLVAAVGVMQAHPQVWIGVDLILFRETNSDIVSGDDG